MPHRHPGLGTVALLAAATLLTGCGAPREPSVSLGPADTVKAAQLLLTDDCLTRQGLTPPRPKTQRSVSTAEGRRVDDALFGTGAAELSLTLPSGHVVSQHTDGCLAAALEQLYGDQRRWFHVSTTVNNLKSKAPPRDRAAYRELRQRAVERARSLLTTSTTTTEQAKGTQS